MATTICPVVYRDNRLLRWGIAAQLHILGAVTGGALVGFLLGLSGRWVGAVDNTRWSLVIGALGLVGVCYGLAELALLHLPRPQLARQVPQGWRRRFHPWITAILYGVELGGGLTTRIVTGMLYVIVIGLVGFAEPRYGAAIFALFGLSRGSSAMAMSWLIHRPSGSVKTSAAMQPLINLQGSTRTLAGIVMALLGGYWLASVVRLFS